MSEGVTLKFGAPQRRMIHNGLNEYEKNVKAAKREASRSWLSITDATVALEMLKAAREAVPQVLPDDHDGTFTLTDETRVSVASGLLTLSAALLKDRDRVGKKDTATTDIQHKIDEVEALRASLLDQRDLFEYSSAYRDDPTNTEKLLASVLPPAHLPSLEEISEWPFSWRKEAEEWASAVLEARNQPEDSTHAKIPPRPSFLPNAKQEPLL